jgi:hypothetical protein
VATSVTHAILLWNSVGMANEAAGNSGIAGEIFAKKTR